MQQETTRRALFGFVATAGVIAAIPAAVIASMKPAPTGVYAAYLAADARFNALPRNLELDNEATFRSEEDAYHAAHDNLSRAIPTDWQEFLIWYEATSDGSDQSKRALATMRTLVAQEGR